MLSAGQQQNKKSRQKKIFKYKLFAAEYLLLPKQRNGICVWERLTTSEIGKQYKQHKTNYYYYFHNKQYLYRKKILVAILKTHAINLRSTSLHIIITNHLSATYFWFYFDW